MSEKMSEGLQIALATGIIGLIGIIITAVYGPQMAGRIKSKEQEETSLRAEVEAARQEMRDSIKDLESEINIQRKRGDKLQGVVRRMLQVSLISLHQIRSELRTGRLNEALELTEKSIEQLNAFDKEMSRGD